MNNDERFSADPDLHGPRHVCGRLASTHRSAENRSSFNGVSFRQVTIDPDTFATTPVSADAGASSACLGGVTFEGLLDDVANMPQ